MKEYYSIGEIGKIYGISPETLRFYEKKGLISPERKANSYRVYALRDIWKLNTILGMRRLGFSLDSIGDYLVKRSMEKERALVEEEIEIIDRNLEVLQKQKEDLSKRLDNLRILHEIQSFGEVKFISMPQRSMVRIESPLKRDEEIDLAFHQLEEKEGKSLSIFTNINFGTLLEKKDIEEGNFGNYQSAFCLLDQDQGEDFLPPGLYASLLFKGPYENTEENYRKILSECRDQGYRIQDPVLEIYRYDIHSTSREEEYITEIQIRLST